MGDLETRVVDLEVLIEEDVEVDVAGSFVDDLFAAKGVLDVLEGIEQLKGFERGLDLRWVSGSNIHGLRASS